MHHDGLEQSVMGHGEVVGIEYTTTAILFGVHQYDNVFVGRPCQPVVQVFQVKGGQVALAVERVEMGVEGGVAPDAKMWRTGAAVDGGRLHCHDVETVAQRFERFMGEKGFRGFLGIVEKSVHLTLLIPLCHKGDMDAACGVGSLLKSHIGRDVVVAGVADEDVGGHHGMRETHHGLLPVVVEFHCHVSSILWHRCEKYVLERATLGMCLIIRQPFLKQGGEGVAVYDLSAAVVAHDDLTIASYWNFTEMMALAPPMRHHMQFIDGYFLMMCVAGEHIIDT